LNRSDQDGWAFLLIAVVSDLPPSTPIIAQAPPPGNGLAMPSLRHFSPSARPDVAAAKGLPTEAPRKLVIIHACRVRVVPRVWKDSQLPPIAFDAIGEFDRINTPDQVIRHMASTLGKFGFNSFPVLKISNAPKTELKQIALLNGWPEEWSAVYEKEQYFRHDPWRPGRFAARTHLCGPRCLMNPKATHALPQ
jgi:hypothetical protein